MTERSTFIVIMVQVSSALFKGKTVELDGGEWKEPLNYYEQINERVD